MLQLATTNDYDDDHYDDDQEIDGKYVENKEEEEEEEEQSLDVDGEGKATSAEGKLHACPVSHDGTKPTQLFELLSMAYPPERVEAKHESSFRSSGACRMSGEREYNFTWRQEPFAVRRVRQTKAHGSRGACFRLEDIFWASECAPRPTTTPSSSCSAVLGSPPG